MLLLNLPLLYLNLSLLPFLLFFQLILTFPLILVVIFLRHSSHLSSLSLLILIISSTLFLLHNLIMVQDGPNVISSFSDVRFGYHKSLATLLWLIVSTVLYIVSYCHGDKKHVRLYNSIAKMWCIYEIMWIELVPGLPRPRYWYYQRISTWSTTRLTWSLESTIWYNTTSFTIFLPPT